MELPNLTIIDGLFLAVVVISLVRGYLHGCVRELIGISGWVAAFIVAFVFTPSIRPLMPEIGLFGDYADACLIASFLAFIALFLLTLAIFALLTPVIPRSMREHSFGALDSLLGLVFGVARGVVIVVGGYMLYDAAVPDADKTSLLTASASFEWLEAISDSLRNLVGDSISRWLGARIEALSEGCHGVLDVLPEPL